MPDLCKFLGPIGIKTCENILDISLKVEQLETVTTSVK